METTHRPLILDEDVIDLDPFGQHEVVWVKGNTLAEGMVLVDPDLLTPEAVVDHKIGRAHNGAVTLMLLSVNTGRHTTTSLTANKLFPVAGR